MKINHIHIRNFRKLKNCRIDFDGNQTIFVGANNSGKTSAISAIIWFLQKQRHDKFSTREFTLTNWEAINKLADSWFEKEDLDEKLLDSAIWDNLVPSMDIWIDVEESEAYRVYKIIPSLSWKKDLVGMRLKFEPRDVKILYADYKAEVIKVNNLKSSPQYKETPDLELYPKNLRDFLNHGNNLSKYFEVKYYVLDSEKVQFNSDTVQVCTSPAMEENPLDNLICIDSIEAFREFSDPEGRSDSEIDTLSKQLQNYYNKNFGDDTLVVAEDLKLMQDIVNANASYDIKLQKCFSVPINELANINYPGFQNPSIRVKSNVNIVDSISHESSVQFSIQGKPELSLPEKYNGLGLRNLISMYLKLVQFREQWTSVKDDSKEIKPIHLVFIEEPEAHLHAQAQQVFVRKAMDALTNADDNAVLKANPNLKTQLIISTHSNHIVNEVDMNSLRYFRRDIDEKTSIPISKVINLSRTFGKDEEETKQFVTRYIRLTHCDIFFADAVVLVEGAAERILVPHFIQRLGLDNHYISVIEINGSHAHRFEKLIEKLGLTTLIITDLDAQDADSQATLPKIGQNQTTNNDTIKKWLGLEKIDALLSLSEEKKIKGNVRIAYQTGINVKWNDDVEVATVYPYTFEDSLTFTNINIFKADEKLKKLGTATTFYNYLHNEESLKDFHEKVFRCLENKSGAKAEFATTLLFAKQFEELQTPSYIKEGLLWINECLTSVTKTEEDGK